MGRALVLLALLPGVAHAHGIWGHVHVTGWAVENMEDDELRHFLLDDPEVFNALLFGAAFTDTGYARDDPASRAYSEHTHWEPFVEDFVEWIRVNDPPPWTSLESKKRVAFLMGCASHGLQDSIFDSLFLSQVEERDGAGQSITDPGTDGFLSLDGHIRFIPQRDIPMDTVLELYAGLPEEVTEEVIDASVERVTSFYLNAEVGVPAAAGLGEIYAPLMPWGRLHYLDPEVPGSLHAEIYPTLRYQQALWARLHGDYDADDTVAFAFPDVPRRLRSSDASTVDSWVTLVFGAGVRYEGDLVELLDDGGQPVPFQQANTRWGAEHTRVIRVQPSADLRPGDWYTARLRAGVERIDGATSTEDVELRFQVACADPDDPACPALDDLPVARIDGLPEEEPTATDPGESADTGTPPASEAEAPPVEEAGCGCTSAPSPWRWLPLARRR